MGNKGSSQDNSKTVKRQSSLGAKAMIKDTNKKGKAALTMDDFDSISTLGKGAFGEVKLVRKKDTQALYAVKIMLKRNLKQNQIPRLLAERDLMAFADHEYIVQLHYSFQNEEKLFLVMDFMQGGDLMGMLIEKDIFSVEATRFYIGELCLAVHSVHTLGYCHRDLKPDNVLLDSNGHVKLADFGLAKQLKKTEKIKPTSDESTTTTTSTTTETKEGDHDTLKTQWKDQKKILAHSMVGTPDYMAPEIFTHDGYDEECDWWGVGCIMFECLAGYAPFYSGGETDVQDTVRNVKNWDKKLNLDRVKRSDKNAADLISKLICHFSNRLNFDGIKHHPFFKGFNWENAHENEAPYHKPDTLEDELDTRYFNYDSDESDEEDEAPVKKPVKKIQDFTFYVKDDKPHDLTNMWTGHDDAKEE